jgi:hypothetical protein
MQIPASYTFHQTLGVHEQEATKIVQREPRKSTRLGSGDSITRPISTYKNPQRENQNR